MKIRHGDTVVIISGKDKGKTGTVERVLPGERRVVVSGANMRTRHVKKTPQQAGRILRYEASMDWSKVMIVDPKTKKPSRIGFTLKDGKKMRVSKASGTEIAKAAKAKVEKKAKKKEAEMTKGTEVTDVKKKTSDTSATSGTSDTSSQKQPFWKKMKFGSSAMEQAEVPEQTNMEKDHSIPSQELHVRKGSRGS